MFIARGKNGKRLFGFSKYPLKKGENWDSQGAGWIELPNTWCEKVTYENSPVRIRALTPTRNFLGDSDGS